jgi:hypothetical protein
MKNWFTLTVEEYQTLMGYVNSDLQDLDKEIQVCALLAGKTPTDIEAMQWDEFIELKKKVSFVYSTPPNTKPVKRCRGYSFIYDIRKINTGRYISIQYFLQQDFVSNLHNLAACIIKPRWGKYDPTNHEKYASDVKQMPFIHVYSSLLFFCEIFTSTVIEVVKESNKIPENILPQLMLLKNHLVGCFMPSVSQSTSV